MVVQEKGLEELVKEVGVVERTQEEMSQEVDEYVEETKAPLLQHSEAVANLDIQRIRKLL